MSKRGYCEAGVFIERELGAFIREHSSQLEDGGKLSYLYLAALIFGCVVVPTVTIVLWLVRGLDSVSIENLVKAVFGSLGAAVPAAFLSTAVMLPIVYLGVRRPSALSRVLERLAYIGYAIPPLAFGLSLIFFAQRAIPGLYQTLWLLIYAYMIHFMAEAIGPARSTDVSSVTQY